MRFQRFLVCILPLLSGVAGCAMSSGSGPQAAVLIHADATAQRLVAYLQSQNVPLTQASDGETRIQSSARCRAALIGFLNLDRLRMEVCAGNIANQNTTRDANGKLAPYRRQFVSVTSTGEGKICADQSPFKKRFEPGNPDADAQGFVNCSNVDIATEMIDAQMASTDYELAATVLRRLDPEIVIAQTVSAPSVEATR